MENNETKLELKTVPCVRCGYCCILCVCPFGVWDEVLKRCAFLEGDRPGFFYCGKYEEIEANPSSKWSPSFGTGCCSSLFNETRQEAFRNLCNCDLFLWIDDRRPAPEGYNVVAATVSEALAFLSTRRVQKISFDHDLGEGGEAYEVASVIEQAAHNGELDRLEWQVHSANPIGAERITAAMKSADRFWMQRGQ